MTIIFEGRKLHVDYEFTPGCTGTMEEPPTGDEIIVTHAWLIGARRARRIPEMIIDAMHDNLTAAIIDTRKTLDIAGEL